MAGELNPTSNGLAPRAQRSPNWRANAVAGGVVNNTAVTLKAGVAGQSFSLEGFDFQNVSGTATEFVILSGANVIYRGYAPATMAAPVSIPNLSLVSGTPLWTNAGEDLKFQCVTTGTQTYFNARGGYANQQ